MNRNAPSEKDVKRALKHEQEIVKRHLKILTKNTNGSHRMRTTGRILKYGSISFIRNVWLSVAATLVMTVTLVILMVTVFASVVLSSTADSMKEKIDITIYLKPGTSEETLSKLSEIIKEDSNVKNVNYSRSDEESALALQENSGDQDMLEVLDDESIKEKVLNNMPATMRISVYEPNNLDGIKNIVNENVLFVENRDTTAPTYESSQNEISTITKWANVAKNGGLILGAVFLIISILVIFNTIRMAIFSRREEIYMMKLVGADNNFIRGPFLVEAEICGAISGILASCIGVFGFKTIAPKLSSFGVDIAPISAVVNSNIVILVFASVIIAGIIVGAISARLAVHKYLR